MEGKDLGIEGGLIVHKTKNAERIACCGYSNDIDLEECSNGPRYELVIDDALSPIFFCKKHYKLWRENAVYRAEDKKPKVKIKR